MIYEIVDKERENRRLCSTYIERNKEKEDI